MLFDNLMTSHPIPRLRAIAMNVPNWLLAPWILTPATAAMMWMILKIFQRAGVIRGGILLRKIYKDPQYWKFRAREWEIKTLPTDVAMVRARALLRDETRFRCEPSCNRHPDLLEQLSPLSRELFREFDVISTLGADSNTSIGPAFFIKSRWSDFLEIGGSEDDGLFLHPCSEIVFEGFLNRWDQNLNEESPTIYHWILMVDQHHNSCLDDIYSEEE